MTDLVFRSGVKYYVSVMSRNRAGLVSRSCSDALVFDRTPPLPGDVYVGRRSSSNRKTTYITNNSIVLSWKEFSDLESGIRSCNISILDKAGHVLLVKTRNTSSGNITLTEKTILLHGKYRATVECMNNAGLVALSSSVFVIDNTPPIKTGPVLAGVSRDNVFQYQSDDKSITATWPPFADPESGIKNYYVGIGSQPYQDDIVSFKNVYLATRIIKTDLSLSHGGIYYITVIGTNMAGLSANVSSVGLVIDTSSPPLGNDDIKDGLGGEDIDYFSPKIGLSAHWENITDPESGIMQSQYCLGTKPHGCQIKPMTNIGRSKSFTCPDCNVYEGERVYVTVQVTNGVGLRETRSSDGMLLDASPPLMGDVLDGSHITGLDYNVVLAIWNVSASWFGVEDVESGVKSCTWTIQSNSGVVMFQDDIRNNTSYEERNVYSIHQTYKDLNFIKNMIYFNVFTCLNKAELQSTVRSDGFKVEPIWPAPAVVRDGSTQGIDLVFQTSTQRVGANWDPFLGDNRDPVANYELAIGTAAGKYDVLRFTSVGLKRNVEINVAPDISDLDVLEVGKMYYVTVKAISRTGHFSMQHSNGFTVDPSPPKQTGLSVSHRVIDQSTQIIEISASWDGVLDGESGISSSGYCLGTTPHTCVSGYFPAGASTFGTIGPFSPDWWMEYFVTVVVVNGAGLRTVMSSKKLVFDISPPSEGSVIDGIGYDIDFMNSTSFVSIQWEGFEDEESGVASCLWSLLELSVSENRSAFGNETIVFTQPVKNKGNLTRLNLGLVPGARYVNKITCKNGDGFSSAPISDGVSVDVTAPNAGLVRDGSSLSRDAEYQSSTTVVEAVWSSFEDHESGIMGYRWGLGTTPDDVGIVNFTSTGTTTSGKAENVTLIHGLRYYVTVEATNGAGMTSHGWSNGFTVDDTHPELIKVNRESGHHDQHATLFIHTT